MRAVNAVKTKVRHFAQKIKQFWRMLPKSAQWFLVYNTLTTFGSLYISFLVPFLRGWGHLTVSQIFLLESIFTITVLVAEIPTGVIADKISKKLSVILGDILFALGTLLFALTPNFWIFLAGQILMGIGHAFLSGAYDALEYEILASAKQKHVYDAFLGLRRQISMAGFIIANLLGILLVKFVGIRAVVVISGIATIIALIPFVLFVKEPKIREESAGLRENKQPDTEQTESFAPDYMQIIKQAWQNLKTKPKLRHLVFLSVFAGLISSWAWWMSQTLWEYLGISAALFGFATIIRKFVGIIYNQQWPKWVLHYGRQRTLKTLLLLSLAILLASLVTIKIPVLNLILLSIFMALVQEFVTILQKPKQELINSVNRSTLLSFESLVYSISFSILTPLIGKFAQLHPIASFYVLIPVSLAAIYYLFNKILQTKSSDLQ